MSGGGRCRRARSAGKELNMDPEIKAFLDELDRRITDPTAGHSDAGRDWMEKMKPAIRIQADMDPARFKTILLDHLKKCGVLQ